MPVSIPASLPGLVASSRGRFLVGLTFDGPVWLLLHCRNISDILEDSPEIRDLCALCHSKDVLSLLRLTILKERSAWKKFL